MKKNNERVYAAGHEFKFGQIRIKNNKFGKVTFGGKKNKGNGKKPEGGSVSRTVKKDGKVLIDAGGCYAIPGLIDAHIHGCVGFDFSGADTDGIMKMLRYQAENGITSVCPTLMTLPEETLAAACGRICGVMKTLQREESGVAEPAGIYLEGPFISASKAGAQNPAFIAPPDIGMFERLQAASGGNVKILAIAPEAEGAMEAIGPLSGKIVVTVAHTNTDYATAACAFKAGAKMVTHLYNGMSSFGHREPNVVGAALDNETAFAEIVCDGVHLHPASVRIALRALGGRRLILISDSMMATGLSDGVYELGGLSVRVTGKEARLIVGNNIAGSASNLMDCLRIAVKTVGIPLAEAVRCASGNPARMLGIDGERGSISEGMAADLVLLDNELNVKAVFVRGRQLM
jgi:N-acetylglucosamine-6-phosphate deacetylase